jgi:membrane protein EpsK
MLFVVLAFQFWGPSLTFVGMATLVVAMYSFSWAIIFWKRVTPDLSYKFEYAKVKVLQQLLSVGTWVFIDSIGVLLLFQIDILIVNRTTGAYEAGVYAASIQAPLVIRTLAGSVSSSLNPRVVHSIAIGDAAGAYAYTKKSVRFLGQFLAGPIGICAGLSQPILKHWMGAEYLSGAPIMIVACSALVINSSIMPLYSVWGAYNAVKIPALVTLATGVMSIIISLYFTLHLHLGAIGVALGGSLCFLIRNLIFTPLYVGRLLRCKPITLLSGIPEAIFSVIVVAASCNSFYAFSSAPEVPRLLLSLGIGTIFWFGLIFIFIGSDKNKLIHWSKLKSRR